jgi:SAM-dependent methyltransferase
MSRSIPSAHFDALYARSADPWHFATSAYERAKYQATLDALGDRHFRAGLELGCAIGVLTRHLADRCDALLGVDFAVAALVQARQRCADVPHVRFQPGKIPGEFPPGRFDLIVVSEILYFLDPQDIRDTAAKTCAALMPGGLAVLVNYLGPNAAACTGDEAAEGFMAAAVPLTLSARRRTAEYRLDLLTAPA